jgi:carbonic anhydrase
MQTSPRRSRVFNHVVPVTALLGVWLAATGCQPEGSAPAPEKESARPAHWGYTGDVAPEKWGGLSPVYAACEKGQIQSPIDIPAVGTGAAKTLKFDYRATGLKIAHHEHVIDIVDNGHTIQITVDEGSTLTTARAAYALKQFHFHTPSEHTIGGKSFPMEVHFVHQSADGNFAVVSALFVEGPTNDNLAKLIANFPAAKGDTNHLPEVKLDLTFQLPTQSPAYSYLGSFTTPPCTENVEWFVLQQPVTASAGQLQAFADRLNHNNRPLQPLHDREVGRAAVAGSVTPQAGR